MISIIIWYYKVCFNPLHPGSDKQLISPCCFTTNSHINPLNPMSDQDRIFSYNINTISTI